MQQAQSETDVFFEPTCWHYRLLNMRESPWSKPKPHQKLFPKRIFFFKGDPIFGGRTEPKMGPEIGPSFPATLFLN